MPPAGLLAPPEASPKPHCFAAPPLQLEPRRPSQHRVPQIRRGHLENTVLIAPVLIALVALLVAAKTGGAIAERLGQPAVLGELLAGIAMAALPLAGMHGLEFVAHDLTVEMLAQLGVILL